MLQIQTTRLPLVVWLNLECHRNLSQPSVYEYSSINMSAKHEWWFENDFIAEQITKIWQLKHKSIQELNVHELLKLSKDLNRKIYRCDKAADKYGHLGLKFVK